MGFDKSILLTLAILCASAEVFANESKLGFGNLGSSLSNGNLPQVPFISNFSRPSLTGSFFNRFPDLANIFLPFRHKRSVAQKDEQQDGHSAKQTKIAFGLSGQADNRIGTGFQPCNYTAQPGRSCHSCRETITCYPNNVAVVSKCVLLFRYCNNGRCSMNPGEKCRITTTSTTAVETESTSTATSSSTASASSTSSVSTSTASPSSSSTTSPSASSSTSLSTSDSTSSSTSSSSTSA